MTETDFFVLAVPGVLLVGFLSPSGGRVRGFLGAEQTERIWAGRTFERLGGAAPRLGMLFSVVLEADSCFRSGEEKRGRII